MSCIAGGLALGQGRVPLDQIEAMLSAMHRRAPDGDTVVERQHLTLGQAFLRTGSSGAEAANALTLDHRTWVVGDVRLDGREALLRELRRAGREVKSDAPHAELVLHAYCAFGDSFLDHLLGDFAIALWDEERGRLICARDPFGVRPFHWARGAEMFWFASDIAALTLARGVSRDLDPKTVADFLLVGMPIEAEQTIYRDIRCLAPGTRIEVCDGKVDLRRYAEPLRGVPEIRYRAAEDYVAHFAEVFTQAVADRVPGGAASAHLSGGMDSTAIAACAVDARGPLALTGYHITSRSVEPQDDELHYAEMVAAHLRIPLVTFDIAAHRLFERHDKADLRTSFPVGYPHLATNEDLARHIEATGSRVVLSGYSGDAVMSADATYYGKLLRAGNLGGFAREALAHIRFTKSARGLGLRALVQKNRLPAWVPPMPDWVDEEALGVDLAARWERWWSHHHAARSAAEQLATPWVQRQFEVTEALPFPVVGRYPFHDLRLVRLLLGMPNFVLREKWILREAMRGVLPEPVRTREKTAAPGDYMRRLVDAGRVDACADLGIVSSTGVIDANRFASAWGNYRAGAGSDSTWSSWLLLQPLAYALWLASHGGEPPRGNL